MSKPTDPFANLATPEVTQQSGGKSTMVLGVIALAVVVLGFLGWQQLKKPEQVAAPPVVAMTAPPPPQVTTQLPQAAPAPAALPEPQAPAQVAAAPTADGITICSGPANGAFEKVVGDMNQLGLGLNVKPTTGAGDNLTFMHNNVCQYGLINSDDYWGRTHAGNDPRIKNTRVVMGLFEGVVHMVAKKQELAKFSQTDGKRVGVTGGAVATFNTLIVPKTGMNFDVIAYNSTADLVKALADGSVDMIVMVGAKPQPWLKSVNIPGAHLVEFDRFDAVADIMTGKKDGFLGKRPVGSADYPNLAYEKKAGADGRSEDKPVIQLTTRTVLATTKDANEDPKVAAKTKEIFRVLSQNISGLRKDGHDSWKTVTTMNDPGGLPWAAIR